MELPSNPLLSAGAEGRRKMPALQSSIAFRNYQTKDK